MGIVGICRFWPAFALVLGGCSLLVDLDGLSDPAEPSSPSPEASAPDVTTSDSQTADGPVLLPDGAADPDTGIDSALPDAPIVTPCSDPAVVVGNNDETGSLNDNVLSNVVDAYAQRSSQRRPSPTLPRSVG